MAILAAGARPAAADDLVEMAFEGFGPAGLRVVTTHTTIEETPAWRSTSATNSRTAWSEGPYAPGVGRRTRAANAPSGASAAASILVPPKSTPMRIMPLDT